MAGSSYQSAHRPATRAQLEEGDGRSSDVGAVDRMARPDSCRTLQPKRIVFEPDNDRLFLALLLFCKRTNLR